FIAESLGAEQQQITLPPEESAHAIKVRRMRVGDPVHVTNGSGLLAQGVISAVESKPEAVVVEITSLTQRTAPGISLTLAFAIPKGERQATLLDMTVQLGVDSFIPLECEFSAVRFQNKMRERWLRIAHSACKQSRQVHIPKIETPKTVSTLLSELDAKTLVVFGDQHGESIYQASKGIISPLNHIVLLIGPEGGFSESEQSILATFPGAHAIGASDHILRTETAAIALVTLAVQLRKLLS
ncbi:MAG: RsmE family RNA methyltransferase, partial [bacterium]